METTGPGSEATLEYTAKRTRSERVRQNNERVRSNLDGYPV